MHWLTAILAALAYRKLATFEQSMSAADGEWAFLPSDSAPELVLLLSVWLLYRRFGRLKALPDATGPAWLWAPLLCAAAGFYVWATLNAAADLLAPSLMFAGMGYACLFKGARGVRAVLVPAAFLLFAVPMPAPLLNEIVFRLQIGSAEYAGWILFLLGIPALVEGELVQQADQAFKVIETCSGFRSIVTLMMLSIVLSDLFRRPPLHTLVMLAIAPAIGFLLNGFRVVGLILNPHSAIAEVHDLQGVAILLAGLFSLYGVDGLLAALLRSDARAALVESPSAAPPASSPAGFAVFLPLALLVAALSTSFALQPWQPWDRPLRVALLKSLEGEVRGWTSSSREVDRVFLGSTGFGTHLHRRFSRGERDVDLFLAIGTHAQRRDRSLFSPKTGVPGSGWTIQEERRAHLLGVGGPVVVERVLRSGKHLRLVYHWYQGTAGRLQETLRTLLALDNGPFPREREAVALRISTPLGGMGKEARIEAEDALEEFYRAIHPLLDQIQGKLENPRS